MKELRQHWQRLLERYAALSRREQGLVAAVIGLGPLYLAFSFFLAPDLERATSLERAIAQSRTDIATLTAQVAGLKAQTRQDPDAPRKAELAALQQQIAATVERMGKLSDTLLTPGEMNGFLEGLLARNPGLRLVSLKTLPPESILTALAVPDKGAKPGEPAKPAEPAPVRSFDIYRHGVELRLEGRYADLHAYLQQLERHRKGLLWGSLQFSVVEYPVSTLTVVVYTLSADKAWISL